MDKVKLVEISKGKTGTGLLVENDGFISLDLKDNKIIKEAIETEGAKLPKPFIVSAVFQKYGIENANGRVYPEEVLKREVEKYQQAVAERRAYGECNHPDQISVDLGRIAMNIISLEWQGHTLVGKMEIPISDGFRNYGVISSFADMVAQWIISGLKIGVSSRGVGTVMQEGDHLVVGDDYSIICWDVVSTPSTPNAWIETTPEKLQPYIESKQEKKPLIKEDKFTKFEQWLNG